MEFKNVKVKDAVQEEKSKAEREEEVLSSTEGYTELQEEEVGVPKIDLSQPTEPTEEKAPVEEEETKEEDVPELSEEQVLEYIKSKRDGLELNSIDELFNKGEPAPQELPEDVQAFLEYKKSTGRGVDDYVKLNRDFDAMNGDTLIKEYLLLTEEGIDEEDLDIYMQDFDYDEDLDDDMDIKKAKLAKKKAIVKAKEYFNEQKQMYKEAAVSESQSNVSAEDKEDYESYKQYIANAKTSEEAAERRRSAFESETDSVFNKDFKGFEFGIGEDTSLSYQVNDIEKVRDSQKDIRNFVGKYMDDDGTIINVAEYHKALAVAMNPDRFAKFFYEQGVAKATEDVTKKIKNVNMDERRTPSKSQSDGFQARAVSQSSGRGLKIKAPRGS